MKVKEIIRKGIIVVLIYSVAMIGVLLMSDKVERMNELEKEKNQCNLAVKIDK